MMLSMTGFATFTIQIPVCNQGIMIIEISLKSLNSRYFELSCKLPSIFTHLEVQLQRILQKKLHRGHVSLHIKIINSDILYTSIQPSMTTITNYVNAIDQIKKSLNIQEEITIAQILQLPDVLISQELILDDTSIRGIIDAVEKTAEKMQETQRDEGRHLADDITQQLISMGQKIIEIQQLSTIHIHDKKESLQLIIHQINSFQSLGTSEQKTTEQMLLETKKANLLYEIEKLDINEETVRFQTHLTNLRAQMISDETIKGKKIDFTIQELNREINTIASKCSHVGTSSIAIEIKAKLEKAREQAQNII